MGLPVSDFVTTAQEGLDKAPVCARQANLQGWLVDWGNWISLWQNGDINAPDSAAINSLSSWKKTLPAASFSDLHELLDQLLLDSTSRSERLAVLQILKSWQRSMLRLSNSAQAARD